ncbi:MAG: hypothetical protein AB1898_12455 [Acidobacteriota bacterium]
MTPEARQAFSHDLRQALGEAWRRLEQHYRTLINANGALTNRYHHLDLQNFFLDLNYQLRDQFQTYRKWEIYLVDEGVKEIKGEPLDSSNPISSEVSAAGESDGDIARWKEILSVYCRIHARMRLELRVWNDADFKEYEDALSRLCPSGNERVH